MGISFKVMEHNDLIETRKDILAGLEYLGMVEPKFAEAIAISGEIPLRRREGGFNALLEMILSQQVSVASANAISNRLGKRGYKNQDKLSLATEEQIRACGVSRQKARYLLALANSDINYQKLHKQSNKEVIKVLTSIPGIGIWTSEIYLMFSMGKRDVIAAGDLALQESTKILFELPQRPSEKELREIAAKWSPWRSVAARLLWAYYRVEKSREGVR